MRVIGSNPQYYWYLLEDQGRLIFETCCTSSVAWFTVDIELTDEEVAKYHERADGYLNELSSEINSTRPGRADLGSPFLARMLDRSEQELVGATIKKWLAERRSQ